MVLDGLQSRKFNLQGVSVTCTGHCNRLVKFIEQTEKSIGIDDERQRRMNMKNRMLQKHVFNARNSCPFSSFFKQIVYLQFIIVS